MNGFKRYQWMALTVVMLAALAVGCASTSNIANKATFGLVGGEEDPAEAERKAQEREAKQAAKEQEKAEKQARKEEQDDRSLLNRATFGIAGADTEEEKRRKAEEKDAKRAAEQQREAERRAAKQEKERLNREAKAQKQAEKQAEKEANAERSMLSRATFGLAGSESEEERNQKEAEEARKREEKAQREAEKQAAKEAKREEKSERSMLNRATFGLAGTESEKERQEREAREAAERAEKEAKEEQKRAENAERSRLNRLTLGLAGTETEEERQQREAKEAAERAEKEAKEEQKRAENAERSRLNRLTLGLAGTETEEERQQREAEEARKREEKRLAELEKQEENANKTWLNRNTGGLLGEDYSDDALVAMAAEDPDSLTPEQLAKAERRKQEIADHHARQNVQSFTDPEARKLASFPFNTEVISRTTPQGEPRSTATTETYSRADYGIADVGDVRIAVRGQTFKGDTRRSRLIVASNDRRPAQGSLGVGNQRLAYQYEAGTTTATFGAVEFTLSDSMLSVAGVTVPVGEGRKLILLDGNGSPETYDIDQGPTLGN